MSTVRFEHVNKNFEGKVQAVKDFNLEVHDREFVVIIGPSGCGKTTVIRLLAGLEKEDSGDLYIDNERVNKKDPKDRNLALVNQTYALYPHLSVYRNIAFPLEVAKVSVDIIDRRVRAAAHLLELDSLLKQKPKTLSGGEMQRVAIGRSLVRNPKVFLMDEPFSNLDVQFRSGMRAQMQRLHERISASFLFVTHDQQEAMALADRIVVMNEGQIQQVDIPQNILTKPANMFVAGFFGNTRINFIEGCLISDGNSYAVRIEDLVLPLPENRITTQQTKDMLSKRIGQTVVVGFRPEDFSIRESALENPRYPKATVTVTGKDSVKGDNYYLVKMGSTSFSVRLGNAWSDLGSDHMVIACNAEHMQLFDKESEKTLLD